jgi:menaquinone-dependent protoporphyrinogen IX oxidase
MGPSLSGVILFKSRYGTTGQYGEWIRKALRLPLIDPERLDQQVLSACDFLVIGTPVYRGKMLIGDWLRQNEARLRGTRLFLFIVCTHYADTEKQQTMIRDNIPPALLGSCTAWFLPGKLMIDRLTREDSLFLNLTASPEAGRVSGSVTVAGRNSTCATETAVDPVREENLGPLLDTLRSLVLRTRG